MQRVNVRRLLGVFFLVMALLVSIDLLIVVFAFPGVGVFGGISLLCPGNGYAAFCGPLWLLLYCLFIVAIVVAPIINLGRSRRLNHAESNRLMSLENLKTNLAFYTSFSKHCRVHLAFAFGIPRLRFSHPGVSEFRHAFPRDGHHQRSIRSGFERHRPLLAA